MAKGKTMDLRQQSFLRLQLVLFVLGVTAPMIAILLAGWFA